MKYACIARHRHEHPVRLMCDVLEVSPAGFYASQKRAPCLRAIADESLLLHVRVIHRESGESYGAPRVQQELRENGKRVGTKRVARLMREDGLKGRAPRRRRPRTTDSNHELPIAPNLLNRQFDVNGVALNQVWVGDITYVPTQEGWVFSGNGPRSGLAALHRLGHARDARRRTPRGTGARHGGGQSATAA